MTKPVVAQDQLWVAVVVEVINSFEGGPLCAELTGNEIGVLRRIEVVDADLLIAVGATA